MVSSRPALLRTSCTHTVSLSSAFCLVSSRRSKKCTSIFITSCVTSSSVSTRSSLQPSLGRFVWFHDNHPDIYPVLGVWGSCHDYFVMTSVEATLRRIYSWRRMRLRYVVSTRDVRLNYVTSCLLMMTSVYATLRHIYSWWRQFKLRYAVFTLDDVNWSYVT